MHTISTCSVLDFLEEKGYIEYSNDGDAKFQTDIKTLKNPPRRLSDFGTMEIYAQVTTGFMFKVVFNWCMKHMGKIVFFAGFLAILFWTQVTI